MSESLFSPSWYRVASLTPRLRGHTRIYRHRYRGEVWYVLQDHAKGRYYRFTPATYQFIGQMDGRFSVQQLWEIATGRLGDDAPTQNEIVQLLGTLHSADILLCNVPPDTAELLRRSEKMERAVWMQKLKSPLAIRLPLFDPDRFLSRTIWMVRPLFGVFGALLWLAVVGSALMVAGVHWTELTEGVVDRVLSAQNLFAIALIYPVVKVFHELGHGYAVKAWGGDVHEIGIMFLVFMPVPYVDASAASVFRSRRRRLVVGAAGILVETFLASLALFAWRELEPGTARTLAYNVVLVGGISTIFFNGNPLLRYDGYYILADLIEIPNLGKRGSNYLAFLVKRYAFGNDTLRAPHTAPGEPVWFVGYTIAAFIYRIFIYAAIVVFLASRFFFIGILLALWASFTMLVMPVFKGVRFVLTDASLRERRPRAIALTVIGLLIAGGLLFLVPAPLRTRAEGVIWPPEEALVRAGTNGFVEEVVALPETLVAKGELLVRCRDPLLQANVDVLEARLAELQSRYDAAFATDRVQADIVAQEIEDVRSGLARAQERLEELQIRSPVAGKFVLPNASDLPGRYLNQGDLIAFVLNLGRPTIRVVVPQSAVGLVRNRTEELWVRPAEQLGRISLAHIKREVPEGEQQLPSPVLGSVGGGAIAIDPTEQGGTRTFERMFQFELELNEPLDRVFVGGRAYVRFDHGTQPLGVQGYSRLRRVFLKRFRI